MKKCVKCQIVYHSENRLYCLYCDSKLVPASVYDGFRTREEVTPAATSVHERYLDPLQLEYLMGCFFHARSFSFGYHIHRQDYRYGRRYKRTFIQPLNFSSFMRLPWIVINLVDTAFFRLFYKGYCPKCDCKYIAFSTKMGHSQEDCEYNREYAAIMENIRTGKIVINESFFQEEANRKKAEGKRSAYYDLCRRKEPVEAFWDIFTILFSMAFYIYLVTWMVMPIMGRIYHF